MLTRLVTIGQDLAVEIDASPWTLNAIADAAKKFEDAGRTTYGALLKLDAQVPPATSAPTAKLRRRLYVVCVALGVDPGRYGLTTEDRGALWPGDEMLAAMLRRSLNPGLPGADETGTADLPEHESGCISIKAA